MIPSDCEELYREHHRLVERLIARAGIPERERADVAQTVWLTVAGSRPESAPGRSWIVVVTLSTVRQWRRHRRRHPDIGVFAEDVRSAEPARAADADAVDTWVWLEEALPDERIRDAWIRVRLEGYTALEVAAQMGVSERTVREWLARADARVRAADRPACLWWIAAVIEDEARATPRSTLRRSALTFVAGAGAGAAIAVALQLGTGARRVVDRITQDLASTTTSASPGAVSPTAVATTVVSPTMASSTAASPTAVSSTAASPTMASSTAASSTVASSTVASSTVASSTVASSTVARSWAEADALLERAASAVRARRFDLALGVLRDHAARFPARMAAVREVLTIEALVGAERRGEAESRARALIERAPAYAPTMKQMFGW